MPNLSCTIGHRIFGLRLASDRGIRGVPVERASECPDVHVHFLSSPAAGFSVDPEHSPYYASRIIGHEGRPFVTAWRIEGGAYIRLLISDGTTFLIDREGREIWASTSKIAQDLSAEYVLGIVLGLALCCRGVISLHASAVVIGDGAVAFAGVQGAGKSTLAAMFAGAGHDVITDDLAALAPRGDAICLHRGAPNVRVRREALAGLPDADGAVPPFAISADGAHFDIALPSPSGDVGDLLPLTRVYWLEIDVAAAAGAVEVWRMAPHEALFALSADAWASRMLNSEQRSTQFDLLARLVSIVPVRRVKRALALQPEKLIAAIRHDLREAHAASSAASTRSHG